MSLTLWILGGCVATAAVTVIRRTCNHIEAKAVLETQRKPELPEPMPELLEESIPGPDEAIAGHLKEAGESLPDKVNLPATIRHLREAVDLSKKLKVKLPGDKLLALIDMAVLVMGMGNYSSESCQYMNEILDIHQDVFGPYPPEKLEQVVDEVIARGVQFNSAVSFSSDWLGKNHPATVKVYCEIAHQVFLFWQSSCRASGSHTRRRPEYPPGVDSNYATALELTDLSVYPTEQVVWAKHLAYMCEFFQTVRNDRHLQPPAKKLIVSTVSKLLDNQPSHLRQLILMLRNCASIINDKPLSERVCAKMLEEDIAPGDLAEQATILRELAGLAGSIRNLDLQQQLMNKLLENQQQMLGDEHPSLCATLLQLARLEATLNRLDVSAALCRRALDIQQHHSGPKHPDLGPSLYQLLCLEWKIRPDEENTRQLAVNLVKVLGNQSNLPHVPADLLADIANHNYRKNVYWVAEALYRFLLPLNYKQGELDRTTILGRLAVCVAPHDDEGGSSSAPPVLPSAG